MSVRTGILVVGHPASLSSALDLLRQAGHAVRQSEGGQALAALRAEPAELVLVDPASGGSWEFCRDLHADPELNAIPVLLLGGQASLLDRVAAQQQLARLNETVS